MCSDASGDDGWGACTAGLHVVGPWPEQWRQSSGDRIASHVIQRVGAAGYRCKFVDAMSNKQSFGVRARQFRRGVHSERAVVGMFADSRAAAFSGGLAEPILAQSYSGTCA